MTPDLERVARAIGDKSETAGQTGALRSSRLPGSVCEELARVAVVALMEVSEDTQWEGAHAFGLTERGGAEPRIMVAFQAMLRAVLGDQ